MSSPAATPPSEDPTAAKDCRFQSSGTPCEWAESYHPGGFHPVHFGDVFRNRYEVIRKPGNGSFSTVWLALDSDNGVVHGDLQSGNILFGLQELSELGLETLRQTESNSRVDLLRRVDGKQDRWAPRYLAVSEPLSKYALSGPDEVAKLADLGAAFFSSDPPQSVVTPMSLRAPETILDEKIGSGIDIWSLGCLLFEFITGTSLFRLPPFGLSDEGLRDEHLIQLTDVIQPLPENLLAKWSASSKYYGPNGERLDLRPQDLEDEDAPSEDDLSDEDASEIGYDLEVQPPKPYNSLEKLVNAHKAAEVDEEEEGQIVSLLRSIFQYDAARRPSAADLLQHPWLSS
ncbi:serine/threonine-protein kinase SRPK3 [Colletotrichum musicola]|uniref:Serine/threonine-protein kinase SRPK3 n=1 Tax=Colletotrichum musicola TaxID=2175873 RepID=A0A8H6IS57_9PEZI|nr:serine/threonine-protein kinase SRPK3 [Colletotrichum musicola]